MKQAEMAIFNTKNISSKFTDHITDTLWQQNLIQKFPKETFLDLK